MGIANENGIEALNNIVIPRGSTYSKTITLYNPSKDKKIRIHRVGSFLKASNAIVGASLSKQPKL